MLAMLTIIFAAIITLRADYLVDGVQSVTAFKGSFIRDPMGDVLKVFSFVLMGIIYTYSKFYLRSFKMFRADFFTLSLFALLGVMLLISANSMLMIYLFVFFAIALGDRPSCRASVWTKNVSTYAKPSCCCRRRA
jgi:NADH-quinone oxidoreductase subunit N